MQKPGKLYKELVRLLQFYADMHIKQRQKSKEVKRTLNE